MSMLLEKIAKEKSIRENSDRKKKIKKALGIAAPVAAIAAQIPINRSLFLKTMDSADDIGDRTTSQNMNDAAESFMKRKKLNNVGIIRPKPGETNYPSEMFVGRTGAKINHKLRQHSDDIHKQMMSNRGGTVIMPAGSPKSEAMLLHELGHARSSKLTKGLNIGGQTASKLSTMAGVPIGATLGAIAGKREINGKKSGKVMKFIDKHPYLAASVLSAPTLIDEAAASGQAARHLMKLHGRKEGLRRSAPLAPAFGTYLGKAIADTAITGGAYKLSKMNQKKRKEAEDKIMQYKAQNK